MEGTLSKKLPPLSGGGDVTCGAEGGDLSGSGLLKPLIPKKSDCAGFGAAGALADPDEGNLRPLKASVRPPKESCWTGGDDRPPNEVCRL